MRKCHYCDKEELCGVGEDNVPVCEDHYDAYLKCKRQEIDEAFKPQEDLPKPPGRNAGLIAHRGKEVQSC